MNFKVSSEAVNKLYDDTVHPVAVEVGKTLSMVPRAINAALSPAVQWIMQKEYNLAETKQALEEKLSSVDPEKISSPPPYIAFPAVEAISHCMGSSELFDLYANLLSKALCTDTRDTVHPAFVEIIKQLSPIDALVLREFTYRNNVIPACTLSICQKHSGVYIVNQPQEQSYSLELISDIHLSGFSECQIRSSVDNLKRLGLISMKEIVLTQPNVYDFIEKSELYNDLFIQYVDGTNKYIETNKKILYTSSFGKCFCDVCILGIE